MPLKFNLFIKEALLFASTLFLGIFAANAHVRNGSLFLQPPKEFSYTDIGMAILFSTIFFLVILRFRIVSKVFFNIFLVLLIFIGSHSIFLTFLGGLAVPAALVVLGLYFLTKNILMQDIGVILAVSGIASAFGIGISPFTAVIILVAFSFYDIIAVYKTKHMVTMAKGMIESGAIFGFIIPAEWKGFTERLVPESIGERFMILGSGDIGLPLILVASLVKISLLGSFIVAVFALLGLFLTHFLFVSQKERRPMAALPPIATLAIIGYAMAKMFLNF